MNVSPYVPFMAVWVKSVSSMLQRNSWLPSGWRVHALVSCLYSASGSADTAKVRQNSANSSVIILVVIA